MHSIRPARGTILVVHDDPVAVASLVDVLTTSGFAADTTRLHPSAGEGIGRLRPDLVLVDTGAHSPAQVDLCRDILRAASTPVIVLSTSDDELDVVVALELGADDYVVKPYRSRELTARIDAVIRRHATPPDAPPRSRWRAGRIEVDADRHEVLVEGHPVHLPVKEFQLLVALISNADRVVKRRELINAAWPEPFHGDRKTLDVHIKRLRQAIEANPRQPTQLLTVRGVGYRLVRTVLTTPS